MEKARQVKRVLLQAIKIAVGSSIAIYIAHMLGLEYEVSAGSIALLNSCDNKVGDGEISVLSYGDVCTGCSFGSIDIWTYDEFLAGVWNLCIFNCGDQS